MTLPFRPATQPGQQAHPTVPYGQPGAPQATVLQPGQPMPSWDQQAALNGQPNGQPQAQPAAPPAPQFYNHAGQPVDQQGRVLQPVAPAPPGTFPASGPVFQSAPPQGQPPARQNIPDDFVFDGENVPQELRGRTWRQVRGVYGALASDFISRPGAAPAPAPNMPGQPTAAPAPTVQPAAAPDRVASFWQDPLAAIERVVDARLAPINQQSSIQAAESAKNMAASQIPDWALVEAEIIEIAKALPQDQLADSLQKPGWWTNAADLARGRLMSRNQYNNNQTRNQQPQQQQPQQSFQPNLPAQRYVPANQEFFSEQPTAPNGNSFYAGNPPNQWELTGEQKSYAQKMNMSEQEYRDWSGGVQRPQNARRW